MFVYIKNKIEDPVVDGMSERKRHENLLWEMQDMGT